MDKAMIYKLEKRTEFENGIPHTHYEVRSYTHVTHIGVLANGKTLKKGTKKQCEKYIRLKNLLVTT